MDTADKARMHEIRTLAINATAMIVDAQVKLRQTVPTPLGVDIANRLQRCVAELGCVDKATGAALKNRKWPP